MTTDTRVRPLPLLPADEAPTYKLVVVPLKDIDLARAVQKAPSPELVKNIKALGVTAPVDLVKDPETFRYRLFSGVRRFKAAQMAGRKTIPAKLWSGTDGPTRAMIELGQHLLQKPNAAAELEDIETLIGSGLDEARIAAELGRQQVRKRVKLAGLTPGLRAALVCGELSDAVAEACCTLGRSLQRQLEVTLAREGRLTADDVRQVKQARSRAALEQQAGLPDLALPADLVAQARGPDYRQILADLVPAVRALVGDLTGLTNPLSVRLHELLDEAESALQGAGGTLARPVLQGVDS